MDEDRLRPLGGVATVSEHYHCVAETDSMLKRSGFILCAGHPQCPSVLLEELVNQQPCRCFPQGENLGRHSFAIQRSLFPYAAHVYLMSSVPP